MANVSRNSISKVQHHWRRGKGAVRLTAVTHLGDFSDTFSGYPITFPGWTRTDTKAKQSRHSDANGRPRSIPYSASAGDGMKLLHAGRPVSWSAPALCYLRWTNVLPGTCYMNFLTGYAKDIPSHLQKCMLIHWATVPSVERQQYDTSVAEGPQTFTSLWHLSTISWLTFPHTVRCSLWYWLTNSETWNQYKNHRSLTDIFQWLQPLQEFYLLLTETLLSWSRCQDIHMAKSKIITTNFLLFREVNNTVYWTRTNIPIQQIQTSLIQKTPVSNFMLLFLKLSALILFI